MSNVPATKVRLVCWKPELAEEHAETLRKEGLIVDASPLSPSGLIRNFRENSPTVIVIDLDTRPSLGREVAVALRASKATRHIPLVFAGGAKEKLLPVRRELPDAFFSSWAGVAPVIRKAIRKAPKNPVVPPSHMDRYAGSSLVKKLGIAANSRVVLLNAPDDFELLLKDLPEGVMLLNAMAANIDLVLWFVRSRRELEEFMPQVMSLWIIHPKQSGRWKVDFNQNDVREAGLAAGLVDYKVCSVDADWSGLKFARKAARNLLKNTK